MSRWFVRIHRGPGFGAVVAFGSPGMAPSEIWQRLPEELKKPDKVWARVYDLKPRWTRNWRDVRGWRRAHSEHVVDGVRVFYDPKADAPRRTDSL